ncbi:hypothetical protein BJX76DRAFT_354953 [Aspergillus varians]
MDRFTHPSKPNTRIPPILVARHSTTENTTEQFSHLAALSKQKLYNEASTRDPDLRRCIGHHRLLHRSIQEVKDDMKRYLEDVLESESDSDSEDEDDDIIQEQPPYHEHPEKDPTGLFPISASTLEIPTPAPAQSPARSPARSPAPASSCSNSSSTSDPNTVCIREKIFSAMKGFVRRRNSLPSRTRPRPRPLSSAASISSRDSDKSIGSLIRMAEKNASCSEIPVRIHIHEHVVRDEDGDGTGSVGGLERCQSYSQGLDAMQTKSFKLRGRQYAQWLGLKVAAVRPVAT